MLCVIRPGPGNTWSDQTSRTSIMEFFSDRWNWDTLMFDGAHCSAPERHTDSVSSLVDTDRWIIYKTSKSDIRLGSPYDTLTWFGSLFQNFTHNPNKTLNHPLSKWIHFCYKMHTCTIKWHFQHSDTLMHYSKHSDCFPVQYIYSQKKSRITVINAGNALNQK